MTEQEWLACDDPAPMLEFLRGQATERRLRLFCCGCCRCLWWSHLSCGGIPQQMGLNEQYADGLVDWDEVVVAWSVIGTPLQSLAEQLDYHHQVMPDEPAPLRAVFAASWASTDETGMAVDRVIAVANQQERVTQATLIRDILGNPFRPVALDPAWRTSTVVSLAEGIYEERAFDRLPILADALQDAGRDNADVLDHCRGPGPHVRGCWVVDLLLGKK